MTEPYGYDENTDDTDDNGSDGFVRLKREAIRTLERDAKTARQANERVAELERKLAFTEAGVSGLTERQQKALFATLDGDITGDSVRTAAEELGFVQPVAGSAPDADQAAMDRMAQASSGATDPGSEDSIAKLERAAREGGQAALLAQIQADGHLITTAG